MNNHVFSSFVDDAATAALRAFLSHNAGQPVTVELNSVGGSPFAGLEAYHAIKDHGQVDIEVVGLAASAASLLAMGAKKITMRAGSLMMIHRAHAMSLGHADDHRVTAEMLDKIDDQMTAIYAGRAKKLHNKIAALLDAETWFTSDEAVAAGLADHAEAQPPEALAARWAASIGDIPFDQTKLRAALARANNARSTPVPELNTPADESVVQKIYARCEVAGFDLKTSNKIVAQAKGDINVARDLIIDALARRDATPQTIPSDVGNDAGPDTAVAAAQSAIYHRMTGTPVPANDPAAQFQGRSLLDIGAALITASGGKVRSWEKTRLANQVLAEAGRHSTSDFPIFTGVLAHAGQRVLAESYEAARTPLWNIARRRTAADFRSIIIARLGEMPALEKVPESGELTYGTRTEAAESFKLATYAKIFAISRNALINDDLGAFSDSARAWGQAAANVEADQLVALITGGGVQMADGEPLFSQAHNNVISDALDSVTALSAARKKMRDQKGLDGVTPLNLAPRFLVVGSALETMGEMLTTAIQPNTVDEVNVFVDKLQVLVEPRLGHDEWFLFASPAQAEVLAYAYLGDASGPQIETKDGWSTLGLEVRAVFDFGAGATGYRGAIRSSGDDTQP